MPIPDYQTVMLPLLRLTVDSSDHRLSEAVERLGPEFGLTNIEMDELLPSGTSTVFGSRVGWAKTYLRQAGLLEPAKRGIFRITARGRSLLAEDPKRISVTMLDRYEEFRAFKSRKKGSIDLDSTEAADMGETPEEALASAHNKLRKRLENDLLDQIKSASPAFFEGLVVDLLVRMGYGGSRQDAGRAVGRSGDGGIDGIINEDKLGLDLIYIQAKRWEGVVGRPEIQKFAGALQGQRANKGVFITTSNFTREAQDYADLINTKIILIDGERLSSLLVDHNVGVTPVGVYEIKRIDTDYFDGEL